MTAQTTERRALIYFAAILVVFVGALSPVWLADHLSPRLGGLARGGIALLGLGLLALEVVARGRVRFPLLAAFGLMPWVYLVCTAFTHSQLEGAYVYLYKFAPYLCAGILWLLLRQISDRAFFWTILAVGSFISLRALFVFVLPSLSPQRAGMTEAADAFFVYEWIGSLPRVFYPGTGLVFLGILLAIRGCMRFGDRQQWACFAYIGLGLLALLVTMTRGMLLIGSAILMIQVVWSLCDPQAQWQRRLNVATGFLLVLGGIGTVVLVGGYGEGLVQRLHDLSSSDRITLDDRNMIWRQDQAEAAFSMMKDGEDWVVGVGPTASLPLSNGTANELHFGYHSILWIFGLVGLSLLALLLLHALAGGVVGPRTRSYWREAWLSLIFIAAMGAYSPVFSIIDWVTVLAVAAAYVWEPGRLSRTAENRSQPEPEPIPTPVAPTQPAAAKPRRWSQQVGRKHAVP